MHTKSLTAAALAHGFAYDSGILAAAVDGFNTGDFSRRFGSTNSAHWAIGHIAACRRTVARMIGVLMPLSPWERCFAADSDGEHDSAWPSVTELLQEFSSAGVSLVFRLNALSDEDLAVPTRHWATREDSTLAHSITFSYWHEGMHLGQIGLIRSMLGLSPVV